MTTQDAFRLAYRAVRLCANNLNDNAMHPNALPQKAADLFGRAALAWAKRVNCGTFGIELSHNAPDAAECIRIHLQAARTRKAIRRNGTRFGWWPKLPA